MKSSICASRHLRLQKVIKNVNYSDLNPRLQNYVDVGNLYQVGK